MQTLATVFSAGGLHTWCLSFATDFSGMDMTPCAMDCTLWAAWLLLRPGPRTSGAGHRFVPFSITALSVSTATSVPRTCRAPLCTSMFPGPPVSLGPGVASSWAAKTIGPPCSIRSSAPSKVADPSPSSWRRVTAWPPTQASPGGRPECRSWRPCSTTSRGASSTLLIMVSPRTDPGCGWLVSAGNPQGSRPASRCPNPSRRSCDWS